METKNIMIVGVGGQGTLLTSRVLGGIAREGGYDVKISEVHGMAQRGGSVVTFVRFGDQVAEPIVEEGQADVLIAFERLEALRYFRRYRYEPIYPILLHMMENTQEIGWEYQAVTALTLANYPGAETEKVLKAALCHTNWYVRYNAADTLVAAFGNESHRFSDVLEGDDRYAREILLYMLEHAGHRKGDAGK